MIKAVGIDLDDTLCMTEAASFEMENAALADLGHSPMSREMHLRTWGKPLFEIIGTRSPGVNVEAFRAAFRPIITEYTKLGKLDVISEDNLLALDRLASMGKLLMILTSRTHDEVSHLLEPDHRLASTIRTFYYRDNMQFHKPDPRAFDDLLADNDLKSSECVYVGDSISDAQAAKQRGLHFVASLESGLRTRDDFAELPVDMFIPRFADIVDAVATLDGSGVAR